MLYYGRLPQRFSVKTGKLAQQWECWNNTGEYNCPSPNFCQTISSCMINYIAHWNVSFFLSKLNIRPQSNSKVLIQGFFSGGISSPRARMTRCGIGSGARLRKWGSSGAWPTTASSASTTSTTSATRTTRTTDTARMPFVHLRHPALPAHPHCFRMLNC